MASRLFRARGVVVFGFISAFFLVFSACLAQEELPRFLQGAKKAKLRQGLTRFIADRTAYGDLDQGPVRLLSKPAKPGSPEATRRVRDKSFLKREKGVKRWLVTGEMPGSGAAEENLCLDCERGTVSCDETVYGSLEPDDCDLGDGTFVDSYRLELDEFQQLRIDLRSTAFDAFLIVEDEENDCVSPALGSNNDCGGSQDACLELGLPAGTYFVFANSFGTAATGDYELEVSCQTEQSCTSCVIGTIGCGDFRTRDFPMSDCTLPDGSSLDAWTLEVSESQQLKVELSTPDFDGYLWLYDGACEPIASNDDCVPEDSTSSCLLVDLDPGTYYVGVNSYSAGEAGTYDLHVTCVDFKLCRDCVLGEMQCGGRIEAEFPGTDCSYQTPGLMVDLYSINHEAGGLLQISLTATFFDTVLGLFTADCEEIEWNDDCGGSNTNSCLNLDLPAGEYFAAVSSFAADESGTYQLQVDCPGFDRCRDLLVDVVECDQVIQGALPAGLGQTSVNPSTAVYQLDLQSLATVSIEARSTEFDASLALMDDECQELDNTEDCSSGGTGAGAGGVDTCIRSSLPPGTYFIEVSGAEPGSGGAFELEVSCEEFNPCDGCQVGSLGCGDSGEGALSPGDCTLEDGSYFGVWQLSVEAAKEVDIHMTSSEFDTFLFLLDSGCQEIASNDDCSDGTDSCLESVALAAGEYFLVAGSYAAGESGEYALEVSCGEVSICDDCVVGTLDCNDSAQGDLVDGDCTIQDGTFADVWRLSVDVDQEVDIRLSSPDFDAYLSLLDSSCQEIAINDDCSSDTDSCLEGVSLAAGEYLVVANTYAAGETGAYTLEVTCEGVALCEDCIVGSVGCNDSAQGTLGDGDCALDDSTYAEVWRLTVDADRELDISLSSLDFDTVLSLLDSSCQEILSNDDCSSGTDSCLEGVSLSAGEYFLVAGSFAAGLTGAYTLEVTCEGVALCEDCVAEPVDCEGSVSGSLGASGCQRDEGPALELYRLELQQAATVEVTLSSDHFDTFLTVYGADCTPLATNDDCEFGDVTWSCLTLELEAGTYLLGASSFLLGESGDFSLAVTCQDGTGGLQLPGDSNQDGALNITDAVRLLRYLIRGDVPAFPCGDGSFGHAGNKSLLDFDGDQEVDLLDIIGILQHLFEPGPPHVKGGDCTRIPGCPDVCLW